MIRPINFHKPMAAKTMTTPSVAELHTLTVYNILLRPTTRFQLLQSLSTVWDNITYNSLHRSSKIYNKISHPSHIALCNYIWLYWFSMPAILQSTITEVLGNIKTGIFPFPIQLHMHYIHNILCYNLCNNTEQALHTSRMVPYKMCYKQ